MKADFSRVTFDPKNHYSGVLYQQGRVLTDAEFNEAQEIGQHRAETTATHVIGPSGTPKCDAIGGKALPNGGFALDIDDDGDLTNGDPTNRDLSIGRGHYYVDGILCENEEDVRYGDQPYLPEAPDIVEALKAAGTATGFIYLDVFERERTALDRPELREGALNGPDTTARSEVVWQVKVLPLTSTMESAVSVPELSSQAERARDLRLKLVEASTEEERQTLGCELREVLRNLSADAAAAGSCCDISPADWISWITRAPQMAVDTPPVSPEEGPCDAPPDADFLGPENQLYRVEVHSVGADGNRNLARFKWSRENGSVVARIERVGTATSGVVSGNVLGVHSTGRDNNLDFDNGDWVEYIDDVLEMNNGAGMLLQINGDPENNEITLSGNVDVRFDHNPKLRRWDQGAETTTRNGVTGSVPNTAGSVPMNTTDDGWLLLEHNVWVQFADESYRPGDYWIFAGATTGTVDFPAGFQPAHGVDHHYAFLGFVVMDAYDQLQSVLDWRRLFPPLTCISAEDVSFDNCLCDLPGADTVQDAIDILCQRPQGGGCCVTVGEGGEYATLDEAIKTLLEQGQRDICICLLPGDHTVDGLTLPLPVDAPVVEQEPPPELPPELHLKIVGSGLGSRLFLEKPMQISGVKAFALHDVAIELGFLAGKPVEPEGPVERIAIALDHCSEVTLTACHVAGFSREGTDGADPLGALLSITNADRLSLKDNVLEAALPGSLGDASSLFRRVESRLETNLFLAELFGLPGQEEGEFRLQVFKQRAWDAAIELAGRSREERQQIQDAIDTELGQPPHSSLSTGEVNYFRKLIFELSAEQPAVEDLYHTLLDIRRASIKAHPGVALILGSELNLVTENDIDFIALDADDYEETLESNQIIGILSLYGMPPTAGDVIQEFEGRLGQLKSLITKGYTVRDSGGLLGTLQLRGNQLVRIAVSWHVFEHLLGSLKEEGIEQGGGIGFSGLFNRCLFNDNVIEGGYNWIVCVHQSMSGNDFTMRATNIAEDSDDGFIGFVVADSAVYVGNHSRNADWVLSDYSASSSEVANLNITIA